MVWKNANERWQRKWEAEVDGRQLYSLQRWVNSVRRRGNRRKERVLITRGRIRHRNRSEGREVVMDGQEKP